MDSPRTRERPRRRVVVTGVGVVTPLGVGRAATWDALLAGRCSVARTTLFDPSGLRCQLAGQVPAYKVNDFVPKSYRKGTKTMARDSELAVVAADDAFRHAAVGTKAYAEHATIPVDRWGCNIGAGLISADLNELAVAMHAARAADGATLDLHKWGREGMGQLTPLWLLKYLPNMLACHVTIIHGLMGPSNTITCAEASSHLAIGEAFRATQRGSADGAVCGGAESRINHMGLMRQELLGKLNATANDDPAGAVRPFDDAAAGTVFGEGGGLLVIEAAETAQARGAQAHVELAGFGASQDTAGMVEPDSSGHSYAHAIRAALRDAGATPDDVDLLVPFGVGIAAHDAAELNGLRLVFGERLKDIPFAPLKAQLGNLGAGCGAEACVAALAVEHGVVPPAPNTPAGAFNTSKEARELKPRLAVSSVASQGGQNAALVFRKVD